MVLRSRVSVYTTSMSTTLKIPFLNAFSLTTWLSGGIDPVSTAVVTVAHINKIDLPALSLDTRVQPEVRSKDNHAGGNSAPQRPVLKQTLEHNVPKM